jgi:putative flippase GtrA
VISKAQVQAFMQSRTFRQGWRFLLCGAAATALQYSVLALLVDGVDAPAHLAGLFGASVFGVEALTFATSACAAFAYLCGTVTTYVLNRHYTFDVRPPFWRGFFKLLPLNLIGMGFNVAIFGALFDRGMYYLLAQAIATGIVTIYNYAVSRFIVFRA